MTAHLPVWDQAVVYYGHQPADQRPLLWTCKHQNTLSVKINCRPSNAAICGNCAKLENLNESQNVNRNLIIQDHPWLSLVVKPARRLCMFISLVWQSPPRRSMGVVRTLLRPTAAASIRSPVLTCRCWRCSAEVSHAAGQFSFMLTFKPNQNSSDIFLVWMKCQFMSSDTETRRVHPLKSFYEAWRDISYHRMKSWHTVRVNPVFH